MFFLVVSFDGDIKYKMDENITKILLKIDTL